ncbi:unnamed protein product [Mesocestoides corti]|uniref:14-3-3 domain-containing protein n=2 Tax=Mesocestoides corti TaxID=53468 RepID=A0A0R3UG53_MESCO|nr:unnamed protein product [Mesocestoides corti]
MQALTRATSKVHDPIALFIAGAGNAVLIAGLMAVLGDTIEELNELARIYEVLELYPAMAQEMKAVADLRNEAGEEFTLDERNRLSIAYKHKTGQLRSAWRTTMEMIPSARNETTAELIRKVQNQLKEEIVADCHAVIKMLEKQNIGADEAGIFLIKMRGDYFRYLAEVDLDNSKFREEAGSAYEEASKLANELLPSTHSVRLGLALNHSVFLYEIVGDKTQARQLAKSALDGALQNFTKADEKQQEVTFILQLLRDNLTLWAANEDEEENDQVTVCHIDSRNLNKT